MNVVTSLRIRTLKPECWRSEDVCALSERARLLWVVLITMADDEGRFRWRPAEIQAHGYLEQPEMVADLPALADELEAVGLLQRYQADGKTYGAHPKWQDHQKVDKGRPSRFPSPPAGGHPRRVADVSPTPPRHVADASPTPPRDVLDESWSSLALTGPDRTGPDRGPDHGPERTERLAPLAARVRAGEADVGHGIKAWLDDLYAAGRVRKQRWASLEREAETRQQVTAQLLGTTDTAVVDAVKRDVMAQVLGPGLARALPVVLGSFLSNEERRRAAMTANGQRPQSQAERQEASAEGYRRAREVWEAQQAAKAVEGEVVE